MTFQDGKLTSTDRVALIKFIGNIFKRVFILKQPFEEPHCLLLIIRPFNNNGITQNLRVSSSKDIPKDT